MYSFSRSIKFNCIKAQGKESDLFQFNTVDMEKLLKPDKLDIDPNSAEAADEWRHWITSFRGYIDRFSKPEEEAERLLALVTCSTAKVFKYFNCCKTYSEAEDALEKLFVKPPNEIFARYLLSSLQQGPNQTLADFKYALINQAKDCNFKGVTAEKNQDDLIRDSFISGLYSSEIRQRLLEHKTLEFKDAYEIALTLEEAKRDNRVFL